MTRKVARAGVSSQSSLVGEVKSSQLEERLGLRECEVAEVQRRLLGNCWLWLGVAFSRASFALVLAPKGLAWLIFSCPS